MKPYVEDLLHRSLSALEERYQHKVDYKVTFEMFPDHEDFAVRTLGMPGLGALGATIGRIVAMDSPSARERGKFHWGSTLWHEMAHVVTLSLSKYKVPRWFTEGLSMMEERLGGSGWGDPLSLTFIRYFEEDKLLPLNNFNSGFIRPESPEQIAVSYYQAGWLCEFLAEKYGMGKIREMLVAYGENLTTDEVLEQVLETTADQLDEEFKTVLAEALDPYRETLKRPEELPEDLEELKLVVQTKPDNYFLNLALGFRLVGKGLYEEAVPYLEHARELFPSNTGEESPYAILQYAYQKLDEQEKLEELVEEWWARSPLQIDNARFLAEIKTNREREIDQAIAVLEESMFANPLDLESHQDLGALYLSRNLPEQAIREFNVALALEPVDRAAAHLQLAQAHFAAGNGETARQQVLMSLEIAPAYIDAQKLLLEIVRK
jgi:tetratricopeptide (TPR) repeat protein